MSSTTETKAYPNGDAKGQETSASAMAAQVKDQAAETFKSAQEQLDQGIARSNEEIQRLAKEGREFVAKNPGVALAGAVGLGLIVGLAMRKRG
ncbi:hypothetical protein [Cognatishimia maritima]|uniref:Membrane-anchored ribosome-binding protein, inhibits growth in stationary phase, ElaB/YqjD/DUF883 family n=1 Tax=Cognatishimia maritima TaxID=870908 RepID=A0A1M5PKD2_9RHOB|nr:hypothetical protein [Cognatishimia maritima]SHH02276.1 hypothetical protein SAMN04488044_1852 [Cognatishimia maritima]